MKGNKGKKCTRQKHVAGKQKEKIKIKNKNKREQNTEQGCLSGRPGAEKEKRKRK